MTAEETTRSSLVAWTDIPPRFHMIVRTQKDAGYYRSHESQVLAACLTFESLRNCRGGSPGRKLPGGTCVRMLGAHGVLKLFRRQLRHLLTLRGLPFGRETAGKRQIGLSH